jgi:dephospho-CoA kinase
MARRAARRSTGGAAGTLRIGLTGPIGCGKSTVAGWLAEHGAVVIDADQVAREVVEPGEPALEQVAGVFGAGIRRPDGSLDRGALARIVFADPAALERLEGIIRPAVRPRIHARIAAAEKAGAPIVVLEAIGLVEGGYVGDCHEVWLITCTPEEQRARLLARGVDPDDAARRIAAQQEALPGMRAAAARVISTSGTAAEARARVEAALDAALLGRRSASARADDAARA